MTGLSLKTKNRIIVPADRTGTEDCTAELGWPDPSRAKGAWVSLVPWGQPRRAHGQSGCLRQYLDAAKAETDGMNSNGFMDGLMVRQLDGEFIGPVISAKKSNFCLESSSPVSLSPSLPLNWSNTGGARVYARHRDTEVY